MGCLIPYGMREPIFEHKHRDKNYILEIKIYKVPKDDFHPEGFQYSLVLIKDGKMLLGQWQDLMLCDFDGPRKRTIFVKITGD